MTWFAQLRKPRHRRSPRSSVVHATREQSAVCPRRRRAASYTQAVLWTVLIPAKSLPEAKSRLIGATADPAAHARLVLAIRADTVAAAQAAESVARVVIVTDRPTAAGAHPVVVQSRPGLNAALREGEAYAARHWPADGVAALVGDLPALRPAELADALALAAGHARAYVPDAPGTGTTLLTALAGQKLRPAFGPGSAAGHARAATALTAGPGLRSDVDTADDLRAAVELGVGPATRTVLSLPEQPPCVHFDSA
jgi:2-phospho-L-lactate/phosphoenolpyruvate guanylyltransferase